MSKKGVFIFALPRLERRRSPAYLLIDSTVPFCRSVDLLNYLIPSSFIVQRILSSCLATLPPALITVQQWFLCIRVDTHIPVLAKNHKNDSHTQPPVSARSPSMVAPAFTMPLPTAYKHPPFSSAEFWLQATSLSSTAPPLSHPNTCSRKNRIVW